MAGDCKSFESRFEKNDVKSGMKWRDWKQQRKAEYKKWKEESFIKNMKKMKKKEELQELNSTVTSDTENTKLYYTISIAVPGSILDNAQSAELKTYVAGQIARAAAVFNVNEIIVFNDKGNANDAMEDNDEALRLHKKNHGCIQMVRILQYLECPQYLRKYYFPMHKDLEYAGLLNPLDIPHHLRVDDESVYREGMVLNKPVKEGKGSYAYIGLKKTAKIDVTLAPNVRVTIKLDKEQSSKRHYKGIAVSPTVPFKQDNIYWGYNVRLAKNLETVFSESPFKGGYDLKIGTSDKGKNIDSCILPSFKHLLVVFGGLQGIEGSLELDESMEIKEASQLFHYYLNTCPAQGSRTIRTEEAILITMSALRTKVFQLQHNNL